jgi:hypothetical protein
MTKRKTKIDRAIEAIKHAADTRYCRSLDVGMSTPCLGWEAKAARGLFRQEEYDAHKQSHTLMGEHIGLHEAIRILQAL